MDKVISESDNIFIPEAFSDKFETFCKDLQRFITRLEKIKDATDLPGASATSIHYFEPEERLAELKASLKPTEKAEAGEQLQNSLKQNIPPFQDMMDQLQSFIQQYEDELQSTRMILDKSENLARVGLHMGGVLHELNNLVGSMMGHAELAKLTGEEDDITKCVDTALEATKRARTLLRQIRGISRLKNTLDVMNLNETLDSVIHLLDPVIKEKGIRLERELQPVPWVIGSAKAIRQAILILCSSILDSMPKGGCLFLSCDQVGSEIKIGIQEDRNCELEKVQLPLDSMLNEYRETTLNEPPFEESKKAILQEMIDETKGRLECSCRVGKGYAYQILLPVNF